MDVYMTVTERRNIRRKEGHVTSGTVRSRRKQGILDYFEDLGIENHGWK
jgi:hypothetical protein